MWSCFAYGPKDQPNVAQIVSFVYPAVYTIFSVGMLFVKNLPLGMGLQHLNSCIMNPHL